MKALSTKLDQHSSLFLLPILILTLHHLSPFPHLPSLYTQIPCSAFNRSTIPLLADLDPDYGIEAVNQLRKATSASLVRNPAAYLAGVIRHLAEGAPDIADSEMGKPIYLCPPAQAILEALTNCGFIKQGDLNKILRTLVTKSIAMQTMIMETFRERRFDNVMNMFGFFMSHVMQVEKDVREGKLILGLRRPLIPAPGQRYGDLRPFGGPAAGFPPPPSRNAAGQQQLAANGGGAQGRPGGSAAAPFVFKGIGYNSIYRPLIIKSDVTLPTGILSAPIAPRHDYTKEQEEKGVRIAEFHSLSRQARFVSPDGALKLQQLWDSGNKLVSLLDDASWGMLVRIYNVHVIDKTGKDWAQLPKDKQEDIKAVNEIFMRNAKYARRRPVEFAPGNIASLPISLQLEVSKIVQKSAGYIKSEHFDARSVEMLKHIGEDMGKLALEDFANRDPTKMKNPTAYFIGCLGKYTGNIPVAVLPVKENHTFGRGRGRGGRGDGGGGRGGRDGGGERGGGGRGSRDSPRGGGGGRRGPPGVRGRGLPRGGGGGRSGPPRGGGRGSGQPRGGGGGGGRGGAPRGGGGGGGRGGPRSRYAPY